VTLVAVLLAAAVQVQAARERAYPAAPTPRNRSTSDRARRCDG